MERVVTVGRSPKNDIVFDHSSISRHHLQLIFHDNGKVEVVDLNSVNGTFVNGKRINGVVSLHTLDVVVAGFGDPIPWMHYSDPVILADKENSLPIVEVSSTENRSQFKGEEITIGASSDRLRLVLVAIVVFIVLIFIYYRTK